MDPNAFLIDLRELAKDADNPGAFTAELLADIVNTFADLDDWLSTGGFLPTDWAASQTTRKG